MSQGGLISSTSGSPSIPTSFVTNSGIAVPASNILNVLGSTVAAGTNPFRSIGSGDTVTYQTQISQALSAADSTKIGLCNFNSTYFSVDANGFVSGVGGGGFTWTDVTGATQTIAVQNGYLTNRGGGVTYTLPATASIGDTFKIVGKLGLTTITPNANQQLLVGSASGTVGVTGTVVSTNAGDCITFICTTAGTSTIWRADNLVGTWTVN